MKFGKKSTLVSAYAALATIAIGGAALSTLPASPSPAAHKKPDPKFGWVIPLAPSAATAEPGYLAGTPAGPDTAMTQ